MILAVERPPAHTQDRLRKMLVGMVTQTDVVGALYAICLARLAAP